MCSRVDVHGRPAQEPDERHAHLLGKISGHTSRPPVTAWLGDVNAHPRDTRLIPVTRTGGTVVPAGHDRPGSLWGAALADALAVVPPGHRNGEVELLTCGSAS